MIRVLREFTLVDRLWLGATYILAFTMMIAGVYALSLMIMGMLIIGALSFAIVVNRAIANRGR